MRWMTWLRLTPAVSIALVCLPTTSAQAQSIATQRVDLTYDVDTSIRDCPSAADFRATVAHELGYDPVVAGAPTELSVRVTATETKLEGAVSWSLTGEHSIGERRFTARLGECQQMMATLGFVVAVQLQLMAREQQSEADSNTSRESASSTDAPIAVVPKASVVLTIQDFELRSAIAPRTPWVTMIGAGPAIGVGLGPSLIGQGRLFGAVRRGWFALELAAQASLSSTTRESYGGGFRHETRLGSIAACAWSGHVSACGVTKLGQIHVEGVGTDVRLSRNGLLAEAGPRLGYALDLTNRLFLMGYAETLYSLKAWSIQVNHARIWTMPRFAVVAGIDFVARFE